MFKQWFAIGLVLSVVGCDAKKAETSKSEAATTASPTSAATVVRRAPLPSALKQAQAAASALAQQLEDPKGEGTDCEQAYAELEKMMNLANSLPGNQATPPKISKEQYIKACASLPVALQPCLRMSFAMKEANQQHCKDESAKLDDATKEKVKQLMLDALGTPKK